jgi:sigma-B regulation protein RsbU (phosphoserine phosphatase)
MNEHSTIDSAWPEKLGRISSITRDLAKPIELESMLYQVVDAAKELLEAEGGTVWRYLAATHELESRVARGMDPVRISAERGIVGECLRTRSAINVPDCYADARFDRSFDRSTGYRTRCMLTLPLMGYDELLVGVLQLVNRREGVFTTDDETMASVLAAQCAVALQRAQLTERLVESEKVAQEIEVARAVQMGSLPKKAPDIAGYDFAGAFRPADQCGGDTYDFVPTPDGGVMVLMGDATGHGIGPALSATQVRAMLRVAQRLGAGLDDTFRHINDQLAVDLPDDRFVTAFLGHLDPVKHALRYHSGGQGPLLHFHAANGECDVHPPTTAPLGAMEHVSLRQPRLISMAAGDVFALLSDGVYEYCNAEEEEFGEQRVVEFLRRYHDEPMARVRDRLLGELRQFGRGAPQLDDISIVLIRRVAGAAARARPPASKRREFARSFDSLEEIFSFVRAALDELGASDADSYAVTMAIEELFTNMVKYNAEGSGPISLEIECVGDEVICELTDPDSERFDVTAVPDADIGLPAEQRRPGGLGLHLIRRMLDVIDYEYSGRSSRITFRKRLTITPARAVANVADPLAGGFDGQRLLSNLPENTEDSVMFEIRQGEQGTIAFAGRLDAAQCAKAQEFIDAAGAAQAFDFRGLEYISSAGLGVLLKAHKRLLGSGGRLRLINVNSHIYDIFRFSGFDQVFDVERVGS